MRIWIGIAVITCAGVVMFDYFTRPQSKLLTEHFDHDKQPYMWVRGPFDGVTLKDGNIGLGIKASDCGVCHQKIYDEWRRSTHALAYEDLQYQAELAKPGQPRWLCLNCHIPVDNQREWRVEAIRQGELTQPVRVKNPAFDANYRREGISCAACHLRKNSAGDTVIIGPYGDPNGMAPHRVISDKKALHQRCYDCHNATGQITKNFVCWFETGDELAAGPYKKMGRDCVHCHMPAVSRPLVPGLPKRLVRKHLWMGGGVPKTHRGYRDLAELGWGGAVEPALRVRLQLPKRVVWGQSLGVTVVYKNETAGHRLPTGDPERHLRFDVSLRDNDGNSLGDDRLRIGQVWRWVPKPSKLSDNRLFPQEKRTWKPAITLPTNAQKLILEVDVYHVRLLADVAESMQKTLNVEPEFREQVKDIKRLYPLKTPLYSARLIIDSLGTIKRIHEMSARDLLRQRLQADKK